MIFIDRTESNPYFNIAAEEYVLRNFTEDVLMLWESKDSVVLGKHQNAFSEINYPFMINNRIPIIRRISGGGTVFHGPGNLNVTIIRTSKNDQGLIDFKEFTKPLIDFLSDLGIKAIFEGKNNLTIDGKKFSGNSAHIFKNRVLHHGTILYDTDLEKLESIINTTSSKFEDKAVKSIQAVVTNLRNHLADDFNYIKFKQTLKEYLLKYYNINEVRSFTKHDKNEILRLMQERYKSWDWNFGYSPAFDYSNEIIIDKIHLKCSLRIKKAKIEGVEIIESDKRKTEIEQKLTSKKFSQISIRTVLIDAGLSLEEVNIYLKLFNLA